MKTTWLCSLFIGAMVIAGGAFGQTVHADSSSNYVLEDSLDGRNEGTGFGPWVVTAEAGAEWAGAGVWSTVEAEITGWTQAFGYTAKGAGSYVHVERALSTTMSTNDVLEIDFAVNWDGDSSNVQKGFNIIADGVNIVEVRHNFNPGSISLNGFTNSPVLANYGTKPMHWTFTVNSTTSLTVTATSRDPAISTTFTTNLVMAYAHIDSFRLVASDMAVGAPDTRQTYVDNLTLTQYGAAVPEPPLRRNLSLSASSWAIRTLNQVVDFTVTRDFSDAAVVVSLATDNAAMITQLPASVSMAAGVTSATFQATATIPGNSAVGTLRAFVEGDPTIQGAGYGLKGPHFRMNVDQGIYEVYAPTNITFWVNFDDGEMDTNLVAMASSDSSVMTVPATLSFQQPAPSDIYAESAVSMIGSGTAVLSLTYGGVEMLDYTLALREYGYTITGLDEVRVDAVAVYTVRAILPADATATIATIPFSSTGEVELDPDSLVFVPSNHVAEATFRVTGVSTGIVELYLTDDNYAANKIITVIPEKNYGDYIAYDEAARTGYVDGWTLTPSHDSGFQDWIYAQNTGDDVTMYTGAFVGTTPPVGLEGIVGDGKFFGIFANGAAGAEIQLLRPFVAPLADGQLFSIDLGTMYRDGTKGFKLMGEWEEQWYVRGEFYYTDEGYFYKLEDAAEAVRLDWEYAAGVVTISLLKEADGSSYTWTFTRGSETVTVSDVVFSGTVDGFQVYSYNGGNGDENNLYFNRMYIEQAVPPAPGLSISGIWNPDEAKTYTFTLNALNGFTGEVALASSVPGVASVSPARVTLSAGQSSVEFSVAIPRLPADGELLATVLTATSVADSTLSTTYDITVWNPAMDFRTTDENWEYAYVSGGEVWFVFMRSGSFPAQYDVLTSDENVLRPSISNLVTENGVSSYFNAFMEGPGRAQVVITNATIGVGANYGITLTQTDNPSIGGEGGVAFTLTSLSFALPDGYTNCLVEVASHVADNDWNFTELDVSMYSVSSNGVVEIDYGEDPKAVYRVWFSR
ncbi:MAG: hypothetical protein LBN38_03645 [Verrucomicrobiota bacterium]|nr:hypothetical protein [Verrucomicrobiota bacterium]